MSDTNVTQSAASADVTIEQIIERCEPMGNLDDLLIDDLTEEDEDTRKRICSGARASTA